MPEETNTPRRIEIVLRGEKMSGKTIIAGCIKQMLQDLDMEAEIVMDGSIGNLSLKTLQEALGKMEPMHITLREEVTNV